RRGFSLCIARLSGRAPTLAIAPRLSPAEQTSAWKHFRLHLPSAIEWVDSPLGAKRQARHLIGSRLMLSRTNQGPRGSVKPGRFEALLDKLVAVQMDLEPVCGGGTEDRKSVV